MAVRTVVGSLHLGSSFTSSRSALILIWFVKSSPSASRQGGPVIKVYGTGLVDLGNKK